MNGTRSDASSAAPVEAVLFDLDDTLVRYRRSPAELFSAAFESLGTEPPFPVEAYYARFDEFLDRAETLAELREACFADAAAEVGSDPELGREAARAFEELRDHSDVEFLPGAEAAVEALAADARLGIVTNGPSDAQRLKVAAVGLERWAEAVVFAGTDAPAKPDPAPFERALEALGVAPERAVHVGNSASRDVAGARAAGLRSVFVDGGDEARDDGGADWRVHGVADLRTPPW